MASLQSIRQAVAANMRADGYGTQTILAFKDNFEQAIRVVDFDSKLYSKWNHVELVTRLPISPAN